MNREHGLQKLQSLLAASLALPGLAGTGPGITDYWRNEARPSSRPAITQTEPDQYRAHAMQGRARPTQVTPEVNSPQYGCRYSGGPKYPMTCSTRP